MTHTLPELPYARDALAPVLSEEALDYHYGKHHQAYVNKLNGMIPGTAFESASLEDLIRTSEGGLFNNAAQIWNHTFYWNGLSPSGGGAPGGALGTAIDERFGSFDDFKAAFSKAAGGNFGSGWTWLTRSPEGVLEIVNTGNAGNPLRDGHTPLWTVDVWEHAYYIDYRNARPAYLEKLWDIANWDFVTANDA